jgi:hypothetical protein
MSAVRLVQTPAPDLRDRDSQDPVDLDDVPAAIVCAHCGSSECSGCSAFADESTVASKVIAIIPWERSGAGFWRPLWHTATLTTRAADRFFTTLPNGDPWLALRFAVTAELCAALGLVVTALPVVWLVFGADAFMTASGRQLLIRCAGSVVALLTVTMVLLHWIHGFALDWGARRQGSPGDRWRGFRFGCYSCGWDLVTLPVGFLVLAATDGLRALPSALPLGLTLPKTGSVAYLRGMHGLDELAARRALAFAARCIAVPVVVIGVALGALVMAAF